MRARACGCQTVAWVKVWPAITRQRCAFHGSITVVCASFAPCVGFLNFKLDDSYVLSSLQSVAMNGLPAPRYVTRHGGADLQAVVLCDFSIADAAVSPGRWKVNGSSLTWRHQTWERRCTWATFALPSSVGGLALVCVTGGVFEPSG